MNTIKAWILIDERVIPTQLRGDITYREASGQYEVHIQEMKYLMAEEIKYQMLDRKEWEESMGLRGDRE